MFSPVPAGHNDGYDMAMIHEAAGSTTTYYGVELPEHDLSTALLDRRVAALIPDIDPMVDWYWTTSEGRTRVCFRERADAELFLVSLF